MAGGSLTKERATDQQCDRCGRWFGARGISEHEKNCDGESNTGPSDSHVFDPQPDPDQTADQPQITPMTDENEEDDEIECPECGGTDDIVSTERAIRLFREADELTGSRLDALLSYDLYHNDRGCMAVFDA